MSDLETIVEQKLVCRPITTKITKLSRINKPSRR